MHIKDKSRYFLCFGLTLMCSSIAFHLLEKSNFIVSGVTRYITIDGRFVSTELMEILINDNNFEAISEIKRAGLDVVNETYAKGEFIAKGQGLYNVSLNEEETDFDIKNEDDLFGYKKHIFSNRKLSFFKSVKVEEELDGHYKLVMLDSPVNRMIAVKVETLSAE
ncbi:hypothetical protein VT25_14245 [Photobacterium leiognathi subsp. mandapamensis]|nr:hypothetical protein VT25_14245 [Photobacterium leiognathi subsp. mandapamensis]